MPDVFEVVLGSIVGIGNFAGARGVPVAHHPDLSPASLVGCPAPQLVRVGLVHGNEKVKSLKVRRDHSPRPVGDFKTVSARAGPSPWIGGLTGVVTDGSRRIDDNP